MNAPQPITPPYQWRTTDCDYCWEGKVERTVASGFSGPGYFISEDCEECGGTGEIEASCADCGDERPLNDDGVCADCDAIPVELKFETKGQWL